MTDNLGYAHVEATLPVLNMLPQGYSIYEFGVYSGKTLEILLKHIHENQLNFPEALGFDSFEGLPKEQEGIYYHPDWQPGVFNAQEWFNVKSIDEAVSCVRARLSPYTSVKVDLFPGWFSDVLNDAVLDVKNLPLCSYLHIDTDLYISSKQALDFMFDNKLVVPGAIVRYDDWTSTPEWIAGQSLSHKEIVTRLGLKFNRLACNVFQFLGY